MTSGAVILIAFWISMALPNLYTSSSMILVEPSIVDQEPNFRNVSTKVVDRVAVQTRHGFPQDLAFLGGEGIRQWHRRFVVDVVQPETPHDPEDPLDLLFVQRAPPRCDPIITGHGRACGARSRRRTAHPGLRHVA